MVIFSVPAVAVGAAPVTVTGFGSAAVVAAVRPTLVKSAAVPPMVMSLLEVRVRTPVVASAAAVTPVSAVFLLISVAALVPA
ncbi:hypothetical protein D3C76_1635170 [compost metagenome]